MPRLLMDESDEESDEPCAPNSSVDTWTNNSFNTPSVSSVFSYTDSSTGHLPPNPFNTSPKSNDNSTLSNPSTSSTTPNKNDGMCNFPTKTEPVDYDEHPKPSIKTSPKSPARNRKWQPQNVTQSTVKVEESKDDEKLATPQPVVKRKRGRPRKQKKIDVVIKPAFVKLVRIDEVYDLSGGTISITNLEPLKTIPSDEKSPLSLNKSKPGILLKSKIPNVDLPQPIKTEISEDSEQEKNSAKSLRFADLDEVAQIAHMDEWLLQKSTRKSKHCLSPTLRIKQQPQRRSSSLTSPRKDDKSQGRQNDSKLIISVVKVLNSSNESKEDESEMEPAPAKPLTVRRRRGKKRKRLYTVKRNVKPKSTQVSSGNEEYMSSFEEVDSERESKLADDDESDNSLDNDESKELSMDDQLDMEDNAFKEPEETVPRFSVGESEESTFTYESEYEGLQLHQTKKTGELSLTEKIRCDIMKDLEKKTQLTNVPDVEPSSISDEDIVMFQKML